MKTLAGALLAFGLVSLAHAKAEASCGTFEVSKGDIKVQSGAALKPAPAGSKICSGEAVVAGPNSRAKIKMEDGNELNISPDSKIVLENYQYSAADNKKKVLLNILKGKVRATTREENMYNDKAKDGQANTFQVRTKSAVAGVRGTDFLTGFDPSTNKSSIVTFRGKVEFGQPGPGGQIMNPVAVTAGQTTEASAGRAPEPPKPIPPKDLQKMNTETKADTAKSQDGGAGGDTAARGDVKKDDGAVKDDGGAKKEDGGGSKQAGNGTGNGTGNGGGDGSAGPKGPGAPAGGEGERAPASAGPNSGGTSGGGTGGSMLTNNDLGRGDARPIDMPKVPGMPMMPDVPKMPDIPKMDPNFVGSGTSKVNVTIQVGN